jgi:putative PIN family toxin of toxin-antitoxin system
VLDTDVVVAALRSPQGASAALLRCIDQGLITLLLSVSLALEYEAICQLPEHRLVTGLSMKDVDTFLNTLIGFAEPVDVHSLWRPQLRDPSDEMVLETAVNGRAEALVIFNQRDYGSVQASFGTEPLLPREALGRIKT